MKPHVFALLTAALPCQVLASPALAKTVVCPGPTVLEGIDISYWQSGIDWAKVKAAGKKYAIIRAAHALKADTKFEFNWKQCRAQKLHCGVYQYFEPNIDPIAQANLMLKMMGPLKAGDLPPVIDVESKAGATPSQIAAAVGKWLAHVKNATGVTPMIYTGAYFWEGNVKSSAFVATPLWHAQYCTNCCPNIASPWKKWAFWQYSSTGKVSGISGNVDLDKWNGTAAALAQFAVDPGCTAKCDGNFIVKADCSKVDCDKAVGPVAGGLCVNDSIGLRCISELCPAKGDKTVCPPAQGNALLGTCKDGKLTTGDCSQFGAFCSTAAAPQAKCVSAFCAKSPADKPVEKDVCLPDGVRYACEADGDLVKKACGVGTACAMVAGAAVCQSTACKVHCEGSKLIGTDCKAKDCATLAGVQAGACISDTLSTRCVSKFCPATGAAGVCLPDPKFQTVGKCLDGQVVASTCPAGDQVCAKGPAGGACADKACVSDPTKPPVVQDVCLAKGLLHCDAAGKASVKACPTGTACVAGILPALCVAVAQPDAGSNDVAVADAAADAGPDAGPEVGPDGAGADAPDAADDPPEDVAYDVAAQDLAEDVGEAKDVPGPVEDAAAVDAQPLEDTAEPAPADVADDAPLPKDTAAPKDADGGKDAAVAKDLAVATADVPAPPVAGGDLAVADDGCRAGPAGSPWSLLPLLAMGWLLRRRRVA